MFGFCINLFIKIPTINKIGNMLADIIPILILSLKILETLPTTVGPIVNLVKKLILKNQ